VKIFLDSSNLYDIERFVSMRVIQGITTNQKILLKDKEAFEKVTGKPFKYDDVIRAIVERVPRGMPVSIEFSAVSTTDFLEKAIKYRELSEDIVVKVPMDSKWDWAHLVKALSERDIPTNITALMSVEQVLLANAAGAGYASLFYNRMKDYERETFDGKEEETTAYANSVVRRSYDEIKRPTQLIVGSLRNLKDVWEIVYAGTDIITIPPNILDQMCYHPKTEETIKEFDSIWEKLNK